MFKQPLKQLMVYFDKYNIDARYDEANEVLHKILANAHSSYAEWRYDRYNSPIAYQK